MEEKSNGLLARARAALEAVPEVTLYGRVAAVRGLLIEVAGPVGAMQVGGRLEIEVEPGTSVPCEIIGFSGAYALAMLIGIVIVLAALVVR